MNEKRKLKECETRLGRLIEEIERENEKRSEIMKMRFEENKTMSEIADRLGMTRQWVEIMISPVLERVYVELKGGCLGTLLSNVGNLNPYERSLLVRLSKKIAKGRYVPDESLEALEKELFARNGPVDVDEAKKITGMDGMDDETFLMILVKSGITPVCGKIRSTGKKLQIVEKILTFFDTHEKGDVSEIRNYLVERGMDVKEGYIRSILTSKRVENEICNVGKNVYGRCGVLLEKYSAKAISERILKSMRERNECVIDTRTALERFGGSIDGIDNPYLLKSLLVAGGRFSKISDKFIVKRNDPECENVDFPRNEEIVRKILEMSGGKPLGLTEISKRAETLGKRVEKNSLPHVLRALGDEAERVEGGYVLSKYLPKGKLPSDLVISAAKKLMKERPSGFFVTELMKEMEKRGIESPDKFEIKRILEKSGDFKTFGSVLMTIADASAKRNPLLTEIDAEIEKSFERGDYDVSKITERIRSKFGKSENADLLKRRIATRRFILKRKIHGDVAV